MYTVLGDLSYTKFRDSSIIGDEEALSESGIKHVQFMAAEGMEASIPLHKALNTCKRRELHVQSMK